MDEGKLDRLLDLMLARELRETADRDRAIKPMVQEPPANPTETLRLDTEAAAALQRRHGWNRRDVNALEVSPRGSVEVPVADWRMMLPAEEWRHQIFSIEVPAVVAEFSMAYVTPPAEGVWLYTLRSRGTGSMFFGTENVHGAPPVLAPVALSSLTVSTRFHDRAVPFAMTAELGSNAASITSRASILQNVFIFDRLMFWQGTRAFFSAAVVNTALLIDLHVIAPLRLDAPL